MSRKPKSNMGLFFIAVVLIVIFLNNRFGDSDRSQEVEAGSAGKAADSKFLKYDWPRGGADQLEADLAQDLLIKNYYVIFDGSGSMSDRRCSGNITKIVAAKTALRAFASLVPQDAQLGLLAFDMVGTTERVALATQNREEFNTAVDSVKQSGMTPLKSAIKLGIHKLEEQARRQLGYGEYHLVVVTDGEASAGEEPSSLVMNVLSRSPVVIHTIGFCIGEHHSLNQPGRTIYKTANNPEELNAGLEDVLAESEEFLVSSFDNIDQS